MPHSTISATFHLTHNCNLRCAYCYTGEKFGAGMSGETAGHAVDFSLAEARRQSADHLEVVFFGGEPLLRRDLLYWVVDQVRARAGDDLDVSFKMSTNGILLNERTVSELARREVYVSISLDGDPAAHDAQRPDANGNGTAARLTEVIPRLLAWNPCAAVNCVVTPHSAAHLDRSVAWLFEHGFRYVSTAIDYSGKWTRRSFRALRKAYRRLGDWYIDRTLAGHKFYLSCFDERIRTRTRGPLERSERCSIGLRQFSIAPSGRIYPCVQFVREDDDDEFVIGDVVNGFSERRRHAVNRSSEGERAECSGCVLIERCSSWCACVNWQSTGSLDRASPMVCEHDRMLMPIADRVANSLWKRRSSLFIHKQYNPAFPVLDFLEDVVVRELDTAEVDASDNISENF